MKKSNKKKLYSLLGIALGVVLLTGCTQNFCSNIDKANIAYTYDMGVTVYTDSIEDIPTEYKVQGSEKYWTVTINGDNSGVFAYIPVSTDTVEKNTTTSRITTRYTATKAAFLDTIISSAVSSNYAVPSYTYFKKMDQLVLEAAIAEKNLDLEADKRITAKNITAADINVFSYDETNKTWDTVSTDVNSDSILLNFGYVKFFGTIDENGDRTETMWEQWDKWNTELAAAIDADQVPQTDFTSLYKTQMNSKLTNARSCIATQEGKFGHYGNSSNISVNVTTKTWKDAWKKGFFEGLIVYPVSWLIDVIAYGIDPSLSGV